MTDKTEKTAPSKAAIKLNGETDTDYVDFSVEDGWVSFPDYPAEDAQGCKRLYRKYGTVEKA